MAFAATAKPLIIGALALALFVPVSMIQGLVAERQQRRNVAVEEIGQGWGGRQTLAGPYLVVPYERTRVEVTRETVEGTPKERRVERKEWLLMRLPAQDVHWTVDTAVSEKARGLYKARLYQAKVQVRGRFVVPPRYGAPAEGNATGRFGAPRLVFGVSDARGLRSVGALAFDGKAHEFLPGASDALLAGGVHAPLPDLAAGGTHEFTLSLEVAGSEALALAPLGADSELAMRADWPHPSFQGGFLPVRHETGAGGFSAGWKVSRFAAQSSDSLSSCTPGKACAVLAANTLGVSFIEPASLYQRLERASKYGFLFIGLTFAAFMLVELLRRLAIHPIQYALVGLALAMFFLLLTALSEHVAFAWAYSAAALACVGLITGYLAWVLASLRLALAFGAALGALYAVLYALLKAEDHALLGGTLLLFALLAAVMAATRKVDWYLVTAPARP